MNLAQLIDPERAREGWGADPLGRKPAPLLPRGTVNHDQTGDHVVAEPARSIAPAATPAPPRPIAPPAEPRFAAKPRANQSGGYRRGTSGVTKSTLAALVALDDEDGVSASDVRFALGKNAPGNPSSVNAMLSNLCLQGNVVRVGLGRGTTRFRITQKGRDRLAKA